MSSNLQVQINNSPVTVFENTVTKDATIDGKSTASFSVEDSSGTMVIVPGAPASITDSLTGETFNGYVNDTKMTNLVPNTTNRIDVTCVDKQYLIGKRCYVGAEYNVRTAGDIVADLATNALAGEGITVNSAIDHTNSRTAWNAGTLSNVATTANSGGDIELALAGSSVTFQQSSQADFNAGITGAGLSSPASGGVTFTPTPAIQFEATVGLSGLTSTNTYVKIWDKSVSTYTIPSSFPTLFYDMWISDSSPEQKAGLELVCTDGTSFLASISQWNTDAQGLSGAATNNYSGLATNQWYSRALPLYGFSSLGGKTLQYAALVFAGSQQGAYTAFFRNIKIAQNDGVTNLLNIFSSSATAIAITPQQLQNNGYTAMSCQFVTSYERHGVMFSPSYDLSGASIVNSSLINWNITLPNSSFTYSITASLDGRATFLPCTQNGAIPGLLPGMNTNGVSVRFAYVFDSVSNDPTLTPLLSSINGVINPSYTCAKSDIINTTSFRTSGWTGGTLTNLVQTGSQVLQLNGFARSWDDANFANQTIFGSASPAQSVVNRQFQLTTGTGTDVRSRFDFAGNWQNFTAEIDIICPVASAQAGFFYRTTGQQNANNTFAYSILLSTTQIQLGRGTNTSSGAGSFTSISTVSVTLTAGTIYRLKIVVNGSSHQAYINDVLFINATDATYTAAGSLGLRFYNPTGSTQTCIFDNFGVMASLTGTWVSPAIDIHSLGTISNSQIILQTDPNANTSIVSFLTEISLNNGTTWTTCTNSLATPVVLASAYFQALPVPGLTSGTNVSTMTQVKIRLTITATTAAVGADSSTGNLLADIQSVSLFVLGAYNASGSRISPALSINGVGRAGSSAISWNGSQPPNTSISVSSSLDGVTWQNIGAGASGAAPIAQINLPTDPVLDDFSANTALNYAVAASAGGNTANWTFDTANKRLIATNGLYGLLAYSSPVQRPDIDICTLLDYSDGGGLFWRWTDANDYYNLEVHDASAVNNPNMLYIFKVVSGVRSQIASAAISFTRGAPHTFRANMQGTNINVYMDGNTILTLSDSSLSGAGAVGLYNNLNGTGSTTRFYNLRVQFYGDTTAGLNTYHKITLTTTDPTASPAVSDVSMSVHNPNIQVGQIITNTNYSLLTGSNNTISQVLDDLAKKASGVNDAAFYWKLDDNGTVNFTQKTANLAPVCLTGSDMLGVPTVDYAQDTYHNSHWITGGQDEILRVETIIGDGRTTSWTLQYPIDSINSIVTENNVAVSFGVKGADKNKTLYYQVGNNTLALDASLAAPNSAQTYTISYQGRITVHVNVKKRKEIRRMKGVDKSSGKIEVPVTAAQGLKKQDMILQAASAMTQYAVQNIRTIKFDTLRSGLQASHIIALFVSQYQIASHLFIITDVSVSWRPALVNGTKIEQAVYSISATEGAVVGDWTRFFVNLKL